MVGGSDAEPVDHIDEVVYGGKTLRACVIFVDYLRGSVPGTDGGTDPGGVDSVEEGGASALRDGAAAAAAAHPGFAARTCRNAGTRPAARRRVGISRKASMQKPLSSSAREYSSSGRWNCDTDARPSGRSTSNRAQ